MGQDRLAGVILIDAPEEQCLNKLLNIKELYDPDEHYTPDHIRRRLCTFKNLTIPMCKAIDEDNNLRVVSFAPFVPRQYVTE